MSRVAPRNHIYQPETRTWRIELTKGYYALIDEEDFEKVTQYPWHAHLCKYSVYARVDFGTGSARVKRYLHRLIMDAPGSVQVDHINGDTLDNRKANLRYATKATNMRNKGKPTRKGGSSSQYKGVSLTSNGRWHAYINFDSKRLNLGYFEEEKQAAKAYNDAALKYHGEFAFLNDLGE